MINWFIRSIGNVDSTMEDIREQIDIASEISLAVSQPIGLALDANEVWVAFVTGQQELENELALLQQEQLDEKLLAIREGAPSEKLELPSFNNIEGSNASIC